MSYQSVIQALKGGAGSGNFGHDGRIGKIGGSAPTEFSSVVIDEALKFVADLIISSDTKLSSKDLSNDAVAFLRQTVSGDYDLYRGIGLISSRVTREQALSAENLRPGDDVPLWLTRRSTDVSSYTKKPNLAKHYSEGRMSIVVRTNDKSKILVDLENLPKLLRNVKQNILDDNDFKYMKRDKEVLMLEPVIATIISKSGKSLL